MNDDAAPAAGALLNVLKDSNEDVRHAAALTLGRLGSRDPRAIQILSECLQAEDILLRSDALVLLRQLAPDREWAVSLSN
jgi:HEAT repeat protein